MLPGNFEAVVVDSLGGARHIAVNDNRVAISRNTAKNVSK
jgi:hypothetical protein